MAKPTRTAKSTAKKAMEDYPSLVNTTGRLLGQVPEKNKEKPKNNYGKAVGVIADRLSGAVVAKGVGKTINTSMVSGVPLPNKLKPTPKPKPTPTPTPKSEAEKKSEPTARKTASRKTK